MADKTYWESVKAEGGALMDKLAAIIHEGNVRRVRVRQADRVIAEFPLTAGVVGVLLAPALAGIAAIVALVKDCTLEVERVERPASDSKSPAA